MRLRVLQLAMASTLVGAFVVSSHPADLWRVLKDVDLNYCAAAMALNVPVLVLTPLRSSLLFRALGHEVRRNVLVPATIVGFVAGGLTPAASGELLRAQALHGRGGVPLQQSLVAVVYERVMSIYVLLVSAGLLFALGRTGGGLQLVAVLGAGALVFLPVPAAALAGLVLPEEGAADRRALPASMPRRLLLVASRLRSLLADARLLVSFFPVSLAITALVGGQYWLLSRAVGGGIGLDDAWIAYAVSAVAGILALIPLGLGVLDASLAVMLNRLGMTLEQGGIVALLVRALVTLPLVLAAFASFVYLQRLQASPAADRPVGPATIDEAGA